VSSQFHLGFFVCGIDEQPVRISRVTITYELEDGAVASAPPR